MSFDIGLIWSRMPDILGGFGLTLVIWLVGCLAGIALGFLVAVLRRNVAGLSIPLAAWMEVTRGTPFLVQLFLLYFGGPFIGLSLEPLTAGLLGFTLYGAAYFSEIFRAGFAAVPRGHIEAGECLGLSQGQIMRRIIAPEMAVLVLPALVNMIVLLLKETAVLSIITVPELTMMISAIGSENFVFVESLFLLALFYWAMVEIAGWLGRQAEVKMASFRPAT
jgi:polar amino acid transport system permease protein